MVRVTILTASSDDTLHTQIVSALERSAVTVEVIDDADRADRIVVVASPAAAADVSFGRQLDRILSRVSVDDVAIVLADGELTWRDDALSTNALPPTVAMRFRQPPLYIDARNDRGRAIAHLVQALVGRVAPDTPPPAGTVDSRRPSLGSAGRQPWRRRAVILGFAAVLLLAGASLVLAPGDDQPASDAPPRDRWTITLVIAATALVVALVAVTIQLWQVRKRRTLRLDHAPPDRSATVRLEPLDVVFVSYATHDSELAARLVRDLRRDHEVWFARDSLEPGGQWIFEIDRGLRRSKVFILLLSTAALRSNWVRQEMSVAYLLEVERDAPRIIPIEIEPCDAPLLLRTHQMLRLDDGYDEVLRRLQRTLG